MTHPVFTVRKFRFLDRYEVHFARDGEEFLYEIEDLETLATVDAKDGLTGEEFLAAVGCALNPDEFSEFRRLVESL